MAERLHPGVYIQEISSGVRPIEGVSTSTTAFVGRTLKGSIDRPELVTSFAEFQASYGDFIAAPAGSLNDNYLPHAALQYFNNGGKRLYVARVVTGSTTPIEQAVAASVTPSDRQAAPVGSVAVTAINPGAWANVYTLVVSAATVDPTNQFKLTVNRGTDTLETFDNLSVNPDAVSFVDRAVNGRSRFITALSATADPTTVIKGTSTSAATASTATLSDAAKRTLVIEVNGDGPRTITLPAGALADGTAIALAITNTFKVLAPLRGTTPAVAYSGFQALFTGAGFVGTYTLTSGGPGRRSTVRVSNAPAQVNCANILRLGLGNGGSESTGAAALMPVAGAFPLGSAGTMPGVFASKVGFDGIALTETDLVNGLSKLDQISDVNLVAIPGIGTSTVVDAGTSYCAQRQDCFYIGETGKTDLDGAAAKTFITNLTVKSSFGAVYFPWIKSLDPLGQSAPVLVPPSGYIAGIYARTDGRRGVWKAPAGTEANLAGTVGLATQITDAQQDQLNPIGANTIRFFPSSGVVVWGARTLATASDAEYRYVPVRRLALFLERSIFNGIQYAVFEPNDENLWSSLRLNVGAFMTNMFRAGAFQGATPSQAFFVKCDSDTNPQSEIDAGVVNVLVGFAPVRPAEFVVLKISQKSADAAS